MVIIWAMKSSSKYYVSVLDMAELLVDHVQPHDSGEEEVLHNHLGIFSVAAQPLFGVLLEQSSQQGPGLMAQDLWEADVLHEDDLKELHVVLVLEGQVAA